VWRGILIAGWIGLAGCAPTTRVRRVLAPETYVSPVSPTAGQIATVDVSSGYDPRNPSFGPYEPVVVFEREGVTWASPLAITDRGVVRVTPVDADAEVRVYVRHTGLIPRDFQPVTTRSGTLSRALPTAVRFLPHGRIDPADGPFELHLQDLHNVYNEERVEDGDLLLVEVSAPGAPTERYLFRSLEFGLRTRLGAGVLLRAPIPWVAGQRDVGLSPALTASMAINYRLRSERAGWSFVGEQLALLVSAGVGSTVLEDVDGQIDDQLQGAFNAALVGGGVEVFRIVGLQVLGNASAPFRDDLESGWTLAVGLDAVQLARFAQDISSRLLFEHPQHEDRRRRRDREP
jgi:hypothetical protein